MVKYNSIFNKYYQDKSELNNAKTVDFKEYNRKLFVLYKNNSYLFRPKFLVINITGNCPNSCSFCYASTANNKLYTSKENLDLSFLKEIIHFMNPIHIFVLGGEPLLKLDLLKELVFLSCQNNVKKIGLSTSLPFVNDKVIYILKYFHRIKISIDGKFRIFDKLKIKKLCDNINANIILKYTVSHNDIDYKEAQDFARKIGVEFELGWVVENSHIESSSNDVLSDNEVEDVIKSIGNDILFKEDRCLIYQFVRQSFDFVSLYPCPLENSMIAVNPMKKLHCCDELSMLYDKDVYKKFMVSNNNPLENIIINNWAMYNSSCLDCECRYLCKGLCLFGFQKISENHCKLVRIFYKNAINNIYNKYGMDPFLKYNYIMDKIECSNF